MSISSIREELMIPDHILADITIMNIYSEIDYNLYNLTRTELVKLLTCYEICRRIGDDKQSQFYRNVILGKLKIEI